MLLLKADSLLYSQDLNLNAQRPNPSELLLYLKFYPNVSKKIVLHLMPLSLDSPEAARSEVWPSPGLICEPYLRTAALGGMPKLDPTSPASRPLLNHARSLHTITNQHDIALIQLVRIGKVMFRRLGKD